MSSAPDNVMTCSGCGASIYPEHIQRGLAMRMSGQLFCSYCMAEKHKAEQPAGDLVSLALVEESPASLERSGSLHGQTGLGMAVSTGNFKRQLNPADRVATRVRIFHSKMSDGAIRNMEQIINEWLDTDSQITIKYATSTVGIWEGKHAEPNLIVTVFY